MCAHSLTPCAMGAVTQRHVNLSFCRSHATFLHMPFARSDAFKPACTLTSASLAPPTSLVKMHAHRLHATSQQVRRGVGAQAPTVTILSKPASTTNSPRMWSSVPHTSHMVDRQQTTTKSSRLLPFRLPTLEEGAGTLLRILGGRRYLRSWPGTSFELRTGAVPSARLQPRWPWTRPPQHSMPL